MSVEYTDEIKPGHRMVALAAALFMALLGIFFTQYFGVFGREARELVTPILHGDLTRLGDFIGFLAIFLCAVILPIILVIAASYIALLSPSHVTTIDADRRMVTCDFDLPWRKSWRRSYGFDEVRLTLIHDDEGNRIKLKLPDRRVALTLISDFSPKVAEQKFGRLVEIGLPKK